MPEIIAIDVVLRGADQGHQQKFYLWRFQGCGLQLFIQPALVHRARLATAAQRHLGKAWVQIHTNLILLYNLPE